MRRNRRNPIALFYTILGAALLARVLEDLYGGIWHVHTGKLFPLRQVFEKMPLLPAWTLTLEWGLLVLCGFALIFDHRRQLAARIACLTMFVSLLQMYQNQKVLAFLTLLPISLRAPRKPDSVVWALRWQLLILYLFSALNKIYSGFLDGTSLSNTFYEITQMPSGALAPQTFIAILALPAVARVLSAGVVVAEIGLPVLLIKKPRLGFTGVVCLHLGFALLMPGIWPFSLTAVALAALFLSEPS